MLVMWGSARDWWDRKGCRVNVHHLKFNHTDIVDKYHIVMMVTIMISNHNKYHNKYHDDGDYYDQ